MADARGKVLYVGKAKDLRARLRTYALVGGDGRPQIPHLLPRVASVRCIVTTTEKEAPLLENTLIKKHRPPFNVFLRDDKEYLLLRIDRKEEFPRPEPVRFLFGLFPLCSSPRRKSASRTRPCLNHQMGRCPGACAGLVTREEYLPSVDDAVRFLRGKHRDLLRSWNAEMRRLSGEMRFEEAARLRDRIATVERTLLRQPVVPSVPREVDAAGWFLEGRGGSPPPPP